MKSLEDYIRTQLAQGYSQDQIQTVLLREGYTTQTILQAFARVNQTTSSTTYKEQLSNYIFKLLQQGYQTQQIYTYLTQQGYDSKLLKAIFKELHHNTNAPLPKAITHTHQIHSSTLTKIGVMFLALILVGGGFFFMLFNDSSPELALFNLELSLEENSLQPGDTLEFKITAINEGNPGLIEAQFRYLITDASDRIVDQWENSKGIQTRMEFSETYTLPEDLPDGRYKVLATIYYGAQTARASRLFTISQSSEKSTSSDVVPTPSTNSTTPLSPTNQSSSSQSTTSPEDEGQQESLSTDFSSPTDMTLYQQAYNESDPQQRQALCVQITDQVTREACLTALVEETQDAQYCELITRSAPKDDCYLSCIVMGQTDLCEYITLAENKNFCSQLLATSSLSTGDVSHYSGSNQTNSTSQPDSLDDMDIGDVATSS